MRTEVGIAEDCRADDINDSKVSGACGDLGVLARRGFVLGVGLFLAGLIRCCSFNVLV